MDIDRIKASTEEVTRNYFQLAGTAWLSTAFMTGNPLAGKFGRFCFEKAKKPEESEWYSPNEVVYEGHKVALRKFNKSSKGNPVIFVAPEAGHDSQIVDYGPGQSLVECALENYSGDVYVMDKLPATSEHTNYSIDDAVQSIKGCVEALGEPINLIGLCQGGWQSAIYTALFPQDVKSLTLAAAPIDFHEGNAKISKIAETLPLSFYESMVNIGGGNMPGAYIVHGFMMMNAVDRFINDDLNLYNNVDNTVFTERHHKFNSWYHRTQPVPGKMYLQIVKKLFKENQLVKGELEVLGKKVDLSQIHHPLSLIVGEKDDITPAPQLLAVKEYVNSQEITTVTAPAGHIGVFMGRRVVKDYWPAILENLPRKKSDLS